jgi:hypothetical protein
VGCRHPHPPPSDNVPSQPSLTGTSLISFVYFFFWFFFFFFFFYDFSFYVSIFCFIYFNLFFNSFLSSSSSSSSSSSLQRRSNQDYTISPVIGKACTSSSDQASSIWSLWSDPHKALAGCGDGRVSIYDMFVFASCFVLFGCCFPSFLFCLVVVFGCVLFSYCFWSCFHL